MLMDHEKILFQTKKSKAYGPKTNQDSLPKLMRENTALGSTSILEKGALFVSNLDAM